jgi:hypothetical protein
MEYRAYVDVVFESDETQWAALQYAAIEEAHNQRLLPDTWLSVSYPLITPLRDTDGR